MENKPLRIIVFLSVALAVVLAVVSYCGAFVPSTYERDAASMAAQGIGQDLVDLLLVAPLLLVSLAFMLKESKAAFYIYGGTVFYILYSFIIYNFGVHFNRLFLLYCLTLGLSLYAFIVFMVDFTKRDVKSWFTGNVPVRTVGIYLIIVAVVFYLLWLKDLVPAVLTNSIPKSVSDYDLLVNPVHVIDIAIALPGLIIAAVLMMKKHRLGFVLAPLCLVFTVLLAIALAGMVVMLQVRGISDDISVAGIFVVIAAISLVFLVVFLKNIKTAKKS